MSQVNIVRWSLFGTGIAYGFLHNRTLASSAAAKEAAEAYQKKEKLINDAKAAYAKLHQKPAPAGGVITDVDDPNFDVEKFISYKLESL